MTNTPTAPANPVATAALIFAFLVPPIGLALGIVAADEIRRTGQRGRGLAVAGIVVGASLCVLVSVAFVGSLLLGALIIAALQSGAPY